LLHAIDGGHTQAPVLLIDELDRADEEFEAFLLELLSDWQITIPELGTIKAKYPPIVIITSNRTREVHDALKRRCLFHWVDYPTLDKELTILAAKELRALGIEPKVALLSHSNFGSSDAPTALKMRDTLAILREKAPELKVDGEMHGDCALDESIRKTVMPESTLMGDANLLVLPNIDAANISYNLLKTAAGNGIAIGPILLGAAKPVHILTPSATPRRIVNMTTLAVVEAAQQK
jgi:hypothetical protein